MRALFCLLFGVSLLILTDPARRSAVDPGREYLWRAGWLVVFGLVHGYLLLWPGDILLYYGIAGLLLFGLRQATPAVWLTWAAALAAVSTLLTVSVFAGYAWLAAEVGPMVAGEATPSDSGLVEAYEDMRAMLLPDAEALAAELEQRRGGYLDNLAFAVETRNSLLFNPIVLAIFLTDSMFFMLIGMALYRFGILTGAAPMSVYAVFAVGGYAVGLVVNGWETHGRLVSEFDPAAWVYQSTYHLGRFAIVIGHVGLVIGLWKLGAGGWLGRRLARVGRMALTNYIAQSVLAALIFTGLGLGLVGRLSLTQLIAVVIIVWIVQIALSDWVIGRFGRGPLEVAWRWLVRRSMGSSAA